jgi:8-oxo-dGTP pyrophosphatase MutT (NUDIX family)
MSGRVKPLPATLPGDARASAVMLLLMMLEDGLHMLFIRRTEDGRAHGGQIALPGGRQDSGDADLRATALRETGEEVGIHSAAIDILGALTPLYIPVSNYLVHPFIGWLSSPPHYILSEAEVSAVHQVPLRCLSDPARKEQTIVRPASLPGMELHVPAYRFPGIEVPVWGATAMIISELETILLDSPPGLV